MRGRSSNYNPPNRFDPVQYEPIEVDLEYEGEQPPLPTTFLREKSKTILARNESPDVPFTYSVNPYRGCEHGCIYCYARPSHEYLGFSAGLDFETKIMVKTDAASLLAKELDRKSWKPQLLALSGNTDCYQPVERKLRLTRACLEVLLRYRNPTGIITKNSLVLRDLDVLREMADIGIVSVLLSVTTLDPELARVMEPRTSSPEKKLAAIRELASKNIPVGVMVAPVIPGLTDEEIPRILEAAAGHGATTAGYILLRLPGEVSNLFQDWLKRTMPERSQKIINRIRETRSGNLSDPKFGRRMEGVGEIARTIGDLFKLNARKFNLTGRWENPQVEHFRRPSDVQQDLFSKSG